MPQRDFPIDSIHDAGALFAVYGSAVFGPCMAADRELSGSGPAAIVMSVVVCIYVYDGMRAWNAFLDYIRGG